jgi:hypothetical protein
MRAHVNKLIATGIDVKLVIVDYLNQMESPNANGTAGMYDWKQQIENSKALKLFAQDYQIPVFSPYQTDASGEARFAKGILDAADGAMVLEAHDECITFKVTKMRNADDTIVFTSTMNWNTFQIGPENATPPEPEVEDEDTAPKKRKGKSGFANKQKEIYDDPPF